MKSIFVVFNIHIYEKSEIKNKLNSQKFCTSVIYWAFFVICAYLFKTAMTMATVIVIAALLLGMKTSFQNISELFMRMVN